MVSGFFVVVICCCCFFVCRCCRKFLAVLLRSLAGVVLHAIFAVGKEADVPSGGNLRDERNPI